MTFKFKEHTVMMAIFCMVLSSCRYQKIERVALAEATQKVSPVYEKYRDTFFKVFMDEEKNRFNGFTAEWVQASRATFNEKPFELPYQKIKFGDGLVYAGLTISFLSYDLIIQQHQPAEFRRTIKMIGRIIDGVVKSDEVTKKGLNGFMYRDVVGLVDGLNIKSDFLAKGVRSKYMSQSQVVGLMIGYATFNKVIKAQGLNSPEILKIRNKFDTQMRRTARYLIKNDFVIKSEQNPKKRTPRGPYAVITSSKLLQLLNYYAVDQPLFKINWKHWLYWSVGSRGYNSFYSLTTHRRSYYENNLNKEIKTSAATWGPFFHQVLSLFPYDSEKAFHQAEPQWKKWVSRYRNSMAVAVALANFSVIDESFKKMLYDDLVGVPRNHMPDNYHQNQNGWGHDNRWIRLLNLKHTVVASEDTVLVFNGLDFLMLYSALRYSQLKNRVVNE